MPVYWLPAPETLTTSVVLLDRSKVPIAFESTQLLPEEMLSGPDAGAHWARAWDGIAATANIVANSALSINSALELHP
ncbi:hypothetical protein BA190_17945 [Labrys sp. WJW]|nr:hypothetical protein BA190_17945 [Labrys sp. WJW]